MSEKKSKESAQVGDVWRSDGGKLDLRVDEIENSTYSVSVVRWSGINRKESGICAVSSFPRKRKLIERQGVRVGDVREFDPSTMPYRIKSIDGDRATFTIGDSGDISATLSYLASLRLIERDGKKVA